jgi:hypothetical protein
VNLKGKVYKNNSCSAEALQNAIPHILASITEAELQKVSQDLFRRCEACLTAEGGYFQQFL